MKLTHPESGATVDAKGEHAEMYESQGWSRVVDKPTTDGPQGK